MSQMLAMIRTFRDGRAEDGDKIIICVPGLDERRAMEAALGEDSAVVIVREQGATHFAGTGRLSAYCWGVIIMVGVSDEIADNIEEFKVPHGRFVVRRQDSDDIVAALRETRPKPKPKRDPKPEPKPEPETNPEPKREPQAPKVNLPPGAMREFLDSRTDIDFKNPVDSARRLLPILRETYPGASGARDLKFAIRALRAIRSRTA